MKCKVIHLDSNTDWKEVSLVDEFRKSWFYNLRFLFPYCRPKFLIKAQKLFLNSVRNKYNAMTYGGFLENRASFIGFLENEKKCMIHLGIDINNIKPGTEIKVPCDVEVFHVMKDNTKINGWGGRVIMKMSQPWNGAQYLLYGHLSLNNLPEEGQFLKNGDVIGYLGDTHENGGWFPHLHVQCVTEYFYNLFQDEIDKLDGYWFEHLLDWSRLVSDPTELVFEKNQI